VPKIEMLDARESFGLSKGISTVFCEVINSNQVHGENYLFDYGQKKLDRLMPHCGIKYFLILQGITPWVLAPPKKASFISTQGVIFLK
jgi:hypothetical protein